MADPKLTYITPYGGPPNGGWVPGRPTPPPPSYPGATPPPPYNSPGVTLPYMIMNPGIICPVPVNAATPTPTMMINVGSPPFQTPVLTPPPSAAMSITARPLANPAPSATRPAPPAPAVRPATHPGARMTGPKVTIIHPKQYVTFHVMNNNRQPWEQPGEPFRFKVYAASYDMSIQDLIEQLGMPGSSDSERGIVECVELGGGRWRRGTTFKANEDQSQQQLKALGWGVSRGTSMRPVWLTAYNS